MILSNTMYKNMRSSNNRNETSGSMSMPLDDSPIQNTRRRVSLEKTRLMNFCQLEESNEVKKLLRNNESVRVLDPLGRTALHYCMENKSSKIAAMLLNRDLSIIDVRDANGYTALQMSVMAGNHQMVNFLIQNGADARTRDNEQHTLIHWATVCGHVHLIDILAKHGAYLSSTDVHNACPMHYVSQMCGAADEDDGQYHAVSLSLLQKLISKKALVDVLDLDLRTPLFWAASAGCVEACEMLIKAGANLNHRDKDGLTALHCAAARGQSHCIDALLKKKVITVDAVDYSGCTPLFYSVSLGHVETTRALLEKHHGNPSYRDYRQRSPAHCAAAKGSVECLRILRAAGGDLWIRNAKGDYPIHEAALAHQNDAVKYLLGTKPDCIDAANDDGRTCLHIAALTDNLPLVMHLVDNNASKRSVMVCEGQPVTPFDGAIFKSNTDCAEYLRLDAADEKRNNYRTTESNVITIPQSQENARIRESRGSIDRHMKERNQGLKGKAAGQFKDRAAEPERDGLANSRQIKGADAVTGMVDSKVQMANRFVRDKEEMAHVHGGQNGNNGNHLAKNSKFWISSEEKDGKESGANHNFLATLNIGKDQAPDSCNEPGAESLYGVSVQSGQMTALNLGSRKEQNGGLSFGPDEQQLQGASFGADQGQMTDLTLGSGKERNANSSFGPGEQQLQSASYGTDQGQMTDFALGSGKEQNSGLSFGPDEQQFQSSSVRADQGQMHDLSLGSRKEQNEGSSFGSGEQQLQSAPFGADQGQMTDLSPGSGKAQHEVSCFGPGEQRFHSGSFGTDQGQMTDLALSSGKEQNANTSFRPGERQLQGASFGTDQGQMTDLTLGSGKEQNSGLSFGPGERPFQSASFRKDQSQMTDLFLDSRKKESEESSFGPAQQQLQSASFGTDQGQLHDLSLGSRKKESEESSFGPAQQQLLSASFRKDQGQMTDLSLDSRKKESEESSFGPAQQQLLSASFGTDQGQMTYLTSGSGKEQNANSSFGSGEQQLQSAPFGADQGQMTDLTSGSGKEQNANSSFGSGEQQLQSAPFGADQGQMTDLTSGSGKEQNANSSFGSGEQQLQSAPFGADQGQMTDLTSGSGKEQNANSSFGSGEQQLQSAPFGADQGQMTDLTSGSGKEQNANSSFGSGEQQLQSAPFGADQGQMTDLTSGSGKEQNANSSFGSGEQQLQSASFGTGQRPMTDLAPSCGKEQIANLSLVPGECAKSASFEPDEGQMTDLTLGSGKDHIGGMYFGLGDGQFKLVSNGPVKDQNIDFSLGSGKEQIACSLFGPGEKELQSSSFEPGQGHDQATDASVGAGKEQHTGLSFGPGEEELHNASFEPGHSQNIGLTLGSGEAQSSFVPSEVQFIKISDGPVPGQNADFTLGFGKEQIRGTSFGPGDGQLKKVSNVSVQGQNIDFSLGSGKEQIAESSFGPGERQLQSASFGADQGQMTDLILGSAKEKNTADLPFGPGEQHLQSVPFTKDQGQMTDLILGSEKEKNAADLPFGPGEQHLQSVPFTKDQGQMTDLILGSGKEQNEGSSFEPGEQHFHSASFGAHQGQMTDLTLGSRKDWNESSCFGPGEQQLQSASFGANQGHMTDLTLGPGKEQSADSSIGPSEHELRSASFEPGQGQMTDLTCGSGEDQIKGTSFGPGEGQFKIISNGPVQGHNIDVSLGSGKEQIACSLFGLGEGELQNVSFEPGQDHNQTTDITVGSGKEQNAGLSLGSHEGELNDASFEPGRNQNIGLTLDPGREQSSFGPNEVQFKKISDGSVQDQNADLTLGSGKEHSKGSSFEPGELESQSASFGPGQITDLTLGSRKEQNLGSSVVPEEKQLHSESSGTWQGQNTEFPKAPGKNLNDGSYMEPGERLLSNTLFGTDLKVDLLLEPALNHRPNLVPEQGDGHDLKQTATCGLSGKQQDSKVLVMTMDKVTQTENFLPYGLTNLLMCSPSQEMTNSNNDSAHDGTCSEKKDNLVKCRQIFEKERKRRESKRGETEENLRTETPCFTDESRSDVQCENGVDNDHGLEASGSEDVNSVVGAKKTKRRLKCRSIKMRRDAATQATNGQFNQTAQHKENTDGIFDHRKNGQTPKAFGNYEKHLKDSDVQDLQDEVGFEQSMPQDMSKQLPDEHASSYRQQRAWPGQTKNQLPVSLNRVGREGWETDGRTSTDIEFDDADLQKERNAVKWPPTVKHQRWAEKLESVKYIWYDSEDEEDTLPSRRSVSISNSRDSSPDRSLLVKRSNSISVPREYYLRKRSLQAYLARNPHLRYTTGYNLNSEPHARKKTKDQSHQLSSDATGSVSKDDASFKWLYDDSDRFREQMRIYGFHSELNKPISVPHPLSSRRTSSIYYGRSPTSSQNTFKDDLKTTLEQVFGRYKWWQKFCTGLLKPGKNLLQEYVRIFETKRLMMMEMQKAKRIQMLNVNKGPSVDRMLVKQMVDGFNQQAREEHKISEEIQFGNPSEFCKYLRDEIMNLDEEEQLLKKLEKLLHLRTIDEIGLGELTVLRQMISTISVKHPDRYNSKRNKSTAGNGNSPDGKCLWSLANMRSNATKSPSKMAQLHYVESTNRPTMSRHMSTKTDMPLQTAPVILTGNTSSHRLPQLINKSDTIPHTLESTSASSKSPLVSCQMSNTWPNDAAAILPPVYNVVKNTWKEDSVNGGVAAAVVPVVVPGFSGLLWEF